MRLPLIPAVFILLLITLSSPLTSHGRSLDDQTITPYARTLLEQINNYRTYRGLSPLRFDAHLNNLALKHSFDMFHQKRMGHSGFSDRFRRAGSRMCVENVGWNYSTPLKQFDAWRHSSGHDENMLNGEVRYAGIAEIGKYVTFFACR